MRFLASGKVKDIYEDGASGLVFRFSDRISAYDVRFAERVPRKGEVLCGFAEHWFRSLGVPSHFVERASATEIRVRRMEMVPMECVVRGYVYGSLAERLRRGAAAGLVPGGADTRLAARLPSPVFDPTTKAARDVPVDRAGAVGAGLVTGGEFDALRSASLGIYGAVSRAAARAGFVLADLKLEFGRLDGGLVLGDSIGPDEFRLWPAAGYSPGRAQESYDKQVLRDWLSENGHRERFEAERAAGRDPTPPAIPAGVISKITARYVAAYERLTGRAL